MRFCLIISHRVAGAFSCDWLVITPQPDTGYAAKLTLFFLRETTIKPNKPEPINANAGGTGTAVIGANTGGVVTDKGFVAVNSLNCPPHVRGPVKIKLKLFMFVNTLLLEKSLKLIR